jgi:hypothetical protein
MLRRCECGAKRPVFGLVKGEPARWCAKCPKRPADAVDVKNERCECGAKQPTFGLVKGDPARWCKSCPERPADAIDVKNERCECGAKRPTFGLVKGEPARWCANCPEKPADAVDVKHNLCECGDARPTFGLVKGEPARWCKSCPEKPADAVDVVTKRCECGVAKPSFGPVDGKPKDALWCAKCPKRPADAVDVVSERCECGVAKPSFGPVDGKPKDARWCKSCPKRPADAVNVVSERCECGAKLPTFGPPDGKRKDALWCKLCPGRPADAVNVVDKLCETSNCNTHATFGHPGQPASRCAVHKAKDMISLPRKRCHTTGCRELGTHLEPGVTCGRKRRFCETHAPEGSTDFVQRLCAACGLMEVLGPEGRCAVCDPVRRAAYLKAKELEVKAWLDAAGIRYDSHDRMVDGGACVKYRPDFLIYVNGGVYALVLEVDERQHGHYECELVRMLNIAQALGVPTVFLRFNPDGYEPLAGKAVVPLASRREPLLRWIRWLLSPEGDGNPALRGNFCEVRKLFFDGCDERATPVSIGPRLEAETLTP